MEPISAWKATSQYHLKTGEVLKKIALQNYSLEIIVKVLPLGSGRIEEHEVPTGPQNSTYPRSLKKAIRRAGCNSAE